MTSPKRAGPGARSALPEPLRVFDPVNDWKCTTCGTGEGLLFLEGQSALCLACADLDHLVFLPRGDAALSRRARVHSRLCAVVLRFSRARKQYERQGLLVEPQALERAEAECEADEGARALRRERDEVRRAGEDKALILDMTAALLRLFPACPPHDAASLAGHTAVRGSGRVGRSAAGRALDDEALTLAAVAWIRHRRTDYDDLLMSGMDRADARERIRGAVDRVLEAWRAAGGTAS